MILCGSNLGSWHNCVHSVVFCWLLVWSGGIKMAFTLLPGALLRFGYTELFPCHHAGLSVGFLQEGSWLDLLYGSSDLQETKKRSFQSSQRQNLKLSLNHVHNSLLMQTISHKFIFISRALEPTSYWEECQDSVAVVVLATQSCPTLCDPVDYRPPSSSVRGILLAGILECVAIPFSRGIFPTQGLSPRLLHCRQILYCPSYQGSPLYKTLCLCLVWYIYPSLRSLRVCNAILVIYGPSKHELGKEKQPQMRKEGCVWETSAIILWVPIWSTMICSGPSMVLETWKVIHQQNLANWQAIFFFFSFYYISSYVSDFLTLNLPGKVPGESYCKTSSLLGWQREHSIKEIL